MSDFGSTSTRKVRKEHQCEECNRTIRKGEQYERHAGVWEGKFFTFVSCGHCAALRQQISDIDPEFWEGAFGGVGEWFAQDLWREFIRSFEQGLRFLRLSRQFGKRWTAPGGGLMPAPTPETEGLTAHQEGTQ